MDGSYWSALWQLDTAALQRWVVPKAVFSVLSCAFVICNVNCTLCIDALFVDRERDVLSVI